ncbi:C40 family peptidase [Streptacidiphilus sp. MAP12-16]|uniref:C40 family peptidase n=1 Tax=Streptacidiphilus sp. MAP12-16 TaxID=3156300 RepID=UPI003513C370
MTGLLTAAIIGAAGLPGLCPEAGATTVEVRALGIAASKQGAPYQWGATGPNRFDCSGLTYFAYRKAGKRLPRTAQAQYNRAQHIARSGLRPGDLVFFHHGNHVYHVGMYAGGGKMWDAPHTGARVRLERIWNTPVWFGRFP